MSAAYETQAPDGASEPAPDFSIRARPPSPRRLSRKVLMAGAIIAASIVTLALVIGLSERPEREVRQAEAQAAAGGPPESIRNASGQYEASDLPGAQLDAPRDMLWDENGPPRAEALEPPADAAWQGLPRGDVSAGVREAQPDPQAIARASPIIFGGGDRASTSVAADEGEARLDARLMPPRSRYELMAGAVVPAALITELNSEQPGRAIAQVTANVYDSVSGVHLLIPQGARLIGTYDADTTYGERRLVLVWNRLIFPNGWSISLRGMEGADPTGAAGLRDRTDNHLDRLAGAIGLSAIISVIADNAEDDDQNSFAQSVGDAAATEAARTGGRIVDRELSVRPTLRIRAGGAVRLLVTRDIELRPYREDRRR